jgi:hypothetical protein
LAPLDTKNAIVLPRQARDKHRERALKKERRVSSAGSTKGSTTR